MTSLAFDPSGEHLVATSDDGWLRIWRSANGAWVAGRSLGHLPAVAWGRRAIRAANGVVFQRGWPKGAWGSRDTRDDWELGCGDTWLARSGDEYWLVRPGQPGRVGPLARPPGRWLACVPAKRGALALTGSYGLVLVDAIGSRPVPWVVAGRADVPTSGAADGHLLAVGTLTGEVRLRDGSGPWHRRHVGPGRATSVAVSRAAGLLAVGGVQTLRVADLATGQVHWEAIGRAPATDVRFDDDGRTLLCGFADGWVARWVPGTEPTWTPPPVQGWPEDWVGLDRRHAVTAQNRRFVVWSLGGGAVVQTDPLPDGMFTLDGARRPALRWPWLVGEGHGSVWAWNLEKGTVAEHRVVVGGRTPTPGPGGRFAFAPGPEGGAVPWFHPDSGTWGHVAREPVPDAAGWRCAVLAWSEHGMLVHDEAWSLQTVDADGRSVQRTRLGALFLHGVRGTVLPGGGVVFAESMVAHAVFQVDPDGANLRARYRHAGHILALTASPDGARVASASADGSVIVADLSDGRLHRLSGRD